MKAQRPKPAKLACNIVLRREVQSRLELNHSPEVARRLREDFADDPEMRVAPETIYQSIYVQGRGGLRRGWPNTCALDEPSANRAAVTVSVAVDPRHDQHQRTTRRGRRRCRAWSLGRRSDRRHEQRLGHWDPGGAHDRVHDALHLPLNHGALAVQEAIILKTSELPDNCARPSPGTRAAR